MERRWLGVAAKAEAADLDTTKYETAAQWRSPTLRPPPMISER